MSTVVALEELSHRAFVSYVRYFPVAKGKPRAVALLWKALSFGRYTREGRLRTCGMRMQCDIQQYVQRHIYFFGDYEREESKYWYQIAGRSAIIFDIGANTGFYTLVAAAANPRSAVHAFEPTPDLAARLRFNVALNRLQNVVVNPVGIGRCSGRAYLNLCAGADGMNEGMNYVTTSTPEGPSSATELTSIADYCSERHIDRVDLLKMDIEGGEFDALTGAAELLQQRRIRVLLLELTEWAANRYGHTISSIQQLLLGSGYKLYRVHRRNLQALTSLKESQNIVAVARD